MAADTRIAEKPGAVNPAARNRKLLVDKLAAGCWVDSQNWDDTFNIPCANVPTDFYILSIKQEHPNAPIHEKCTCPAMDGGAGSYHKEVVRWQDRQGVWQSNGVLPCSHILVLRFYLHWIGLGAQAKRDLLDTIPGLEQALKQAGHI